MKHPNISGRGGESQHVVNDNFSTTSIVETTLSGNGAALLGNNNNNNNHHHHHHKGKSRGKHKIFFSNSKYPSTSSNNNIDPTSTSTSTTSDSSSVSSESSKRKGGLRRPMKKESFRFSSSSNKDKKHHNSFRSSNHNDGGPDALNQSLDEIVLAKALEPNRGRNNSSTSSLEDSSNSIETPTKKGNKNGSSTISTTSSGSPYKHNGAPNQNNNASSGLVVATTGRVITTIAEAPEELDPPTPVGPTTATVVHSPFMHGGAHHQHPGISPSTVRYALVAAPTHANAATSLESPSNHTNSSSTRQAHNANASANDITGNRNHHHPSRRSLIPDFTMNRVQVHVYDLIHRETILETPWGCDFPIGECFNTINDGMHALGTGAYHAGIEINGIEYAFGSNEIPGQTGVFTCLPKQSPGYQYRTTLDFGELRTIRKQWIQVPVTVQIPCPSSSSSSSLDAAENGGDDEASHSKTTKQSENEDCQSLVAMSEIQSGPSGGRRRLVFSKRNKDKQSSQKSLLTKDGESSTKTKIEYRYREVESFVEGRTLMREMASDYLGTDYELLRKNCCTFVKDACVRLGVSETDIPTWFLNLAETGVATEDAVNTVDGYVLSPIRRILSETSPDENETQAEQEEGGAFEVIVTSNESPTAVGDMHVFFVDGQPNNAVGGKTNLKKNKKQHQKKKRNDSMPCNTNEMEIRETMSWAY